MEPNRYDIIQTLVYFGNLVFLQVYMYRIQSVLFLHLLFSEAKTSFFVKLFNISFNITSLKAESQVQPSDNYCERAVDGH